VKRSVAREVRGVKRSVVREVQGVKRSVVREVQGVKRSVLVRALSTPSKGTTPYRSRKVTRHV
jgi:hypothetical protein